jgi:hypothetical protein
MKPEALAGISAPSASSPRVGRPGRCSRDASDAATSKVGAIGAKLKLRLAEGKQEAQATVLRLADLAERAITDAGVVLDNAHRAMGRMGGRQRGRMRRAIHELSTVAIRARRVVAQGGLRAAGERIGSATRLVQIARPTARRS